jgi:hypothetical protein
MFLKNVLSFALTTALALAIMVSLPGLNASASSQVIDNHGRVVLADEIPTPTPTPTGGSTDSGGSGGGNGGG